MGDVEGSDHGNGDDNDQDDGDGDGRIKCLRAPSHQILAKSAPQKARNRDKVEFATKVRKSSIKLCECEP